MPKMAKKVKKAKEIKKKLKKITCSDQSENKLLHLPNKNSASYHKLFEENQKLKKEQKEFCEMAVRAILHALDCKDHYTYGHSTRVAHYALLLGREVGLEKEDLYHLEMAALFHDIGKIAIPDALLLKSSRLNQDEFQIMKSHPIKSAEILEGFKPFEKIAKYVKHHHERYDGRGYPDGLKGEEIPLFSRLILIADTFDAMTSTRPYRKGLNYDVAFSELKTFSGAQFDPALVEHFYKAMLQEEKRGTKTFKLTIINGEFSKKAA